MWQAEGRVVQSMIIESTREWQLGCLLHFPTAHSVENQNGHRNYGVILGWKSELAPFNPFALGLEFLPALVLKGFRSDKAVAPKIPIAMPLTKSLRVLSISIFASTNNI